MTPCHCKAYTFPHRCGRKCQQQEFAEHLGMLPYEYDLELALFDRNEAREINRENGRER